ncbi:MAG: PspC domain-containing protein, partial [Actinomycetota bacterium]
MAAPASATAAMPPESLANKPMIPPLTCPNLRPRPPDRSADHNQETGVRVDPDDIRGRRSGCESGLIPIDRDNPRRHSGYMNTTTENPSYATTPTDQPAVRQLRRSADDRMLAGVAGGLARYLDA